MRRIKQSNLGNHPQSRLRRACPAKPGRRLTPLQLPIIEWIVDETYDLEIHPFFPEAQDYIDPVSSQQPQILI